MLQPQDARQSLRWTSARCFGVVSGVAGRSPRIPEDSPKAAAFHGRDATPRSGAPMDARQVIADRIIAMREQGSHLFRERWTRAAVTAARWTPPSRGMRPAWTTGRGCSETTAPRFLRRRGLRVADPGEFLAGLKQGEIVLVRVRNGCAHFGALGRVASDEIAKPPFADGAGDELHTLVLL